MNIAFYCPKCRWNPRAERPIVFLSKRMSIPTCSKHDIEMEIDLSFFSLEEKLAIILTQKP